MIIPARNEEGGIANLLAETKPFCDEILVVDGHSTDNTAEVCARTGVKVVLDNGLGKGDAMRVGITHTTGGIIVFMDGDGSHDPRDIPKLIAPIRGSKADLVVASRQLGGTDEFDGSLDSYLRTLGAGLITVVMNYRWNVRLTDCLNGFRAIRRSVVASLELTANGFDIEQQMVTRCLRRGFRVMEVPSHEFARRWGQSKLPTRFGYKLLWRLLVDIVVPWGGRHP